MKICTEPNVRVIAATSLNQPGIEEFLEAEAGPWLTDASSDSEKLSEIAGRVCYMSFGGKQGRRTNKDYLANILISAHGSVLEHATVSLMISGVSRSLTHELIRHRAGFAYSQLSQRYVDETETDYIVPDVIANDEAMMKTYTEAIERAHEAYLLLADQLSKKAEKDLSEISSMTILGNHSSTQVPDTHNVRIGGKAANEVIKDAKWLENEFIDVVQKRGAAIITARGKSSAASAASAAIDAMKSIIEPTPEGHWYSTGILSDGNPYGIQEKLVFSFPCRTNSAGVVEIVKGLPWNETLTKRIKLSEKELVEEREAVTTHLKA